MESENFKVRGEACDFKFTANDLMVKVCDKAWNTANYALGRMVNKELEIIKKTWKPKVGSRYFYSDIADENLFGRNTWYDDEADNHRYDLGLVYKTEEEAIARSREILEMLKGGK